jgi:hypothetical protein
MRTKSPIWIRCLILPHYLSSLGTPVGTVGWFLSLTVCNSSMAQLRAMLLIIRIGALRCNAIGLHDQFGPKSVSQ